MKKRNAIIATILAAVILAAVPLAYAAPGHRGMRGPHGPGMAGLGILGHLKHVQEELELSDAQVDEIKQIFADLHDQNAAYRDALHGGLHGAAEVLLANPNDLAVAQARLDEQMAAEKALRTNMLAATAKAFNVLTPAQRSELADMLKERGERRSERRR